MKILSHPFRFNPAEPTTFAKQEYGDDDYKAQQIEAFIRTNQGKRPIYQDFGTQDPAFNAGGVSTGYEDTLFVSDFSTFYDNIVIDKVNLVGSEGALSKIQIEFS